MARGHAPPRDGPSVPASVEKGLELADVWRFYLNYVGSHFISSAHYEINSQNHCRLGLDRIARRVLRAQACHPHGQHHRRQTPSQGQPENVLHPASQAARPMDRGGYSASLRCIRDSQTQPLFRQGQGVLPPPGSHLHRLETGKETGTMGQGQRRVPLHPRL